MPAWAGTIQIASNRAGEFQEITTMNSMKAKYTVLIAMLDLWGNFFAFKAFFSTVGIGQTEPDIPADKIHM